MAISFPRDFPNVSKLFRTANFDLRESLFQNTLGGLTTQVMRSADPRWVCEYTTPPLNRADAQAWKAWKASLAGMKYFYGYDPEQPYPKNYPGGFSGLVIAGGSTPFAGEAVPVTSLTSSTIILGSLPNAFVFKAGDLVGLVQSANRQVHRVLEDVTASSGGAATLTVEPFVKTSIFTDDATVNLIKPKVKMFLDSESWQAPRDIISSPISFRGIQAVY